MQQPLPSDASPMPRLKTYSAESGYVYRYVFAGQRPALGATEYLFDVSWDRTTWARALVCIADSALSGCDRELGGNERFAIAKMALRRAFDSRDDPARMVDPIEPNARDIEEIVEELGI